MCHKELSGEEAKSSLLVNKIPRNETKDGSRSGITVDVPITRWVIVRCSISFGAPITSAAKHPFQTADGFLPT